MGKLHQVIGVAAFVCAIVITLILINLESAPEISYDGNVNHYSIENVFRHIENIGKVSRAVGTENHQTYNKVFGKKPFGFGYCSRITNGVGG